VFACWAAAASEALLGCCIVVAVAYVAVRGGAFRGSSLQTPLFKLGIGLGGVCGFAGWVPVSSILGKEVGEGWQGAV
jgi:hypothetical protein